MNKPIIIFYEPFEMISYLDQLLEKYDIDYKSFFTKDIRDKYGKPEKFELNDYINI